jgi:hypothetical protein
VHDHDWRSAIGFPSMRLCGYLHSRRRYIWPPNLYLGTCLLTFPKWVLWGRWLLGSRERAERCLCLETSSSRVCDLVLGPVDDRVHLVARLEEVVEQFQAMQDEH